MKTKTVSVDTLTGPALDWVTGKAAGLSMVCYWGKAIAYKDYKMSAYRPSTDWADGGPLIDANPSALPYRSHARKHLGRFEAQTPGGFQHNGDTILIAFCRTLVAEKLGCDVAVPVELLEGQS